MIAPSNFVADITSEEGMELALAVMAIDHNTVSAWRANGPVLEFGWAITYEDVREWNLFMAPFAPPELKSMIVAWLKNQDYGREPDIDGHCSKGWRMWANSSFAATGWQVSFSVQPMWAEYHK